MSSNYKLEFYINKIEKLYPNKNKLNAGEMLNCINKSRATFKRILDANDLHLLPRFTKIEHQRTSAIYLTYSFDIFDVALFLAGCNDE